MVQAFTMRVGNVPGEVSMASVKLQVGDKTYEFPVVEGTEGERGIDISSLRAQTGLVTFDNGYMNTGACQSAVTFLDGEKGILRYRGYPIEQLAERSSFVEVSYLLIYGRLPNRSELDSFTQSLIRHTMRT
jgi:citrate synthase